MSRFLRLGLLGPCMLCFLFLLSACSTQASMTTLLYSQHAATPSQALVQTSCPATGTGRAAIMPSIHLGSHPAIVYAYSPGNSSMIRRYDTVTHTKTDIVKLTTPNHFAGVKMLRISPDGQWITFQSTLGQQIQAIQMIRIDGQYLQTLYCSPLNHGISTILMSPDQKYLLFTEYKQTLSTYLLRLATGKIQTELVPQKNSGIGYEPVKWLNNSSALMTGAGIGVGGGPGFIRNRMSVYLLRDVTKDVTHQASNLQLVFDTSHYSPCLDFDVTPNNTQFVFSDCTQGSLNGQFATNGPSSIQARAFAGGSSHTLYSTSTLAVINTRIISPTSLFFVVGNTSNTPAGVKNNGLWKINSNGTHPMRFFTLRANEIAVLDLLAYTPWSTISRNGSQYVVQVNSNVNNTLVQTLSFGSLNGGQPTSFASATSDAGEVVLAGWTIF